MVVTSESLGRYGIPEESSKAAQRKGRFSFSGWLSKLRTNRDDVQGAASEENLTAEVDISADHQHASDHGASVIFMRHADYPPDTGADLALFEGTPTLEQGDQQSRDAALGMVALLIRDEQMSGLAVISTATDRSERTASIVADVIAESGDIPVRVIDAHLAQGTPEMLRGLKSVIGVLAPEESLLIVGHHDMATRLELNLGDDFGSSHGDWVSARYDPPEFI